MAQLYFRIAWQLADKVARKESFQLTAQNRLFYDLIAGRAVHGGQRGETDMRNLILFLIFQGDAYIQRILHQINLATTFLDTGTPYVLQQSGRDSGLPLGPADHIETSASIVSAQRARQETFLKYAATFPVVVWKVDVVIVFSSETTVKLVQLEGGAAEFCQGALEQHPGLGLELLVGSSAGGTPEVHYSISPLSSAELA